jgi:nucleotide-binding universal stress UspA family protein
MPETVLCAVDDSDAARPVLDTARGLADAWGASLVLIHVVDGDDGDSMRARLGAADDVQALRLVEGAPARTILEAADREDVALIVTGSRGRGSLGAAVLGSVSREVVSGARCPVVVVPSEAHWDGTSDGVEGAEASVVCGVDGSGESLAAAALAGRVATRLGCRLVVVHARQDLRALAAYPRFSRATPPLTGQDDAVRKLAEQIIRQAEEAAGVDAIAVIEPGPPTKVLESVADRESARLIVIATRGAGGLRAALLGSVAAELPVQAARPVMVLSARAAATVDSAP